MNMLQMLAGMVRKRFTNVKIEVEAPAPASPNGSWFMDLTEKGGRWATIEWHPTDGSMGLTSSIDYPKREDVPYGDGVKELFLTGNIVEDVYKRLKEILE